MDKEASLAQHKENVRRNRMARSGFWKWTTLILALIIVIGLYMNGFPSGNTSKEAASEKAVAFINEKLLQGFATAKVRSVTEEEGLFKIEIDLVSNISEDTQNATLYITKDGNLLFPSAIDLTSFQYKVQETTEEQDFALVAAEEQIIGNPNASLTIVEYADFECPFCGQAYWTIKLIMEEYPEEVNLIFKNYPLPKHSYAQKASEAGECANLQGKFEAYHDMLFEHQDKLAVEDLKQYAMDLGLDTESFNECLDSGAMEQAVALDKSEAEQAGVKGTPTFIIGEQKIIGNEKFATFQKVIDEELAKLKENSSVEANTSS